MICREGHAKLSGYRNLEMYSVKSAMESEPQIACKRKEQEPNKDRNNSQKKSRLVFTDLQRRTLFAIFKENKRPSKEMQITISQQLGLELTTFFQKNKEQSNRDLNSYNTKE
ncbi:One cut domain family member 2 [Varanus komodoensis]|nr:One cut domain family member 2 [Varanus komodoensis]